MGVALTQRLAERAATRLANGSFARALPQDGAAPQRTGDLAPAESGHSRRSFLVRTAVVGSALAVVPKRFILEQGTAYAAITDVCGPSNDCASGYSVFCCTINDGANQCPPGSFAAGWWRADGSSWCCGGPRYYVDCNSQCTGCGCGPGEAICPDTCQNCQGRCNGGPTCDQRRVCATRFRYGQCNQQVGCAGNVVCRTVSCTPPYLIPSLTCTADLAVDQTTVEHSAPCLQQGSWNAVAPVRTDGLIEGSPAVAQVPGSPRTDVFVRGSDGNVYWTSMQGPAFGPWTGLGSPPVLFGFQGAPAAVSWAPGRLDLFVRGTDNRLWQRFSENGGSSWSGWFQPVPDGVLASDPVAVSWAPGRLDIFVMGTDGQVWQRFYEGSWNHAWLPRGRPAVGLNGRPAVTTWGPGRLDIFARGTDNRLYQSFYSDGWSSWFRPSGTETGTLASSPGAASWGAGEVAVFTRGTDGGLYWTNYFHDYWSGWVRIGSDVMAADPSAASRGCQQLDVYVQGPNNRANRFNYSS